MPCILLELRKPRPVGGVNKCFAQRSAQEYFLIELFPQFKKEKTNEQISKIITCVVVLPGPHGFCAEVSISNFNCRTWEVCL